MSGGTGAGLPAAVVVRDVGPRDGLQPEAPVPVEGRVRLISALVAAGPAEWQRVGEASRAYVEQVHDVERVADALVELYEGLPR